MVHYSQHQMIVDTIVAPATPAGYGGVAVVRVSGPLVKDIAQGVLGEVPHPWRVKLYNFKDQCQDNIDYGLALYFPGPNSFTGEDVLELHGHGSPILVEILQQRIIALGARYARPGEFSERAFTNGKIDLSQAEAIADLIHASSAQAARAALRSLQGEFSRHINSLVEEVIQLRMYVEASIDFAEEEIDFLTYPLLLDRFKSVKQQLANLQANAKQGSILRDGITAVIIGKTNVGKSTLVNALSKQDIAIVTDIPGTTRDLLHSHINIDGFPVHIIDTAGLRDTADIIEQEGIRRAKEVMDSADLVLYVVDSGYPIPVVPYNLNAPVIIINNKIDVLNLEPSIDTSGSYITVNISAKNHQGIDLLQDAIKKAVGYNYEHLGCFTARQRHLEALAQASYSLNLAIDNLSHEQASELIAEELRQVQLQLNSITGEFTNEDLLSRIFSSFCIGK